MSQKARISNIKRTNHKPDRKTSKIYEHTVPEDTKMKMGLGKRGLTASLRKAAHKAGVVSGNLAFRRVPPLTHKSGSLCRNRANDMAFANYLLSFSVCNFGTCQKEAAYVTSL